MTDARPDAKPLQTRKTLRPRDAATLIVVDSSSGEPRVLLGRRRLDMVFMPGRYVFPGGRVDPGDRHVAVEEDLEPGNLKNLLVAMKGALPNDEIAALPPNVLVLRTPRLHVPGLAAERHLVVMRVNAGGKR